MAKRQQTKKPGRESNHERIDRMKNLKKNNLTHPNLKPALLAACLLLLAAASVTAPTTPALRHAPQATLEQGQSQSRSSEIASWWWWLRSMPV